MSEEIKTNEQIESGKENGATDNGAYIEAINEMKKNSVSRESYEALQKDNKKLLEALIDGKQIQEIEKKQEVNIDELRNDLFGKKRKDINNLEFWNKTLQLRNALIEKGEQDPFLPTGKMIAPTQDDIVAAEKVATIVQECIDISNGNSEFFTNEMMRRTMDTPNLSAAKTKNNPYNRR